MEELRQLVGDKEGAGKKHYPRNLRPRFLFLAPTHCVTLDKPLPLSEPFW